ncbi:hypothetical protein [Peribacillus simplex]|uniref:hypothetical protein n=1 Tax=Peribacillus simplex TaxID=1478 RepID=UPI00366B0875
MGLKNIHKKSLAIELIKREHDLHHTIPNRNNKKYQVFVFPHLTIFSSPSVSNVLRFPNAHDLRTLLVLNL